MRGSVNHGSHRGESRERRAGKVTKRTACGVASRAGARGTMKFAKERRSLVPPRTWGSQLKSVTTGTAQVRVRTSSFALEQHNKWWIYFTVSATGHISSKIHRWNQRIGDT